MIDPRKPVIIEDESELFHIQLVEESDEEDEFTQWLLGDDWDYETDTTQEVSH